MIRIDAVWLTTAPLDMRAGTERDPIRVPVRQPPRKPLKVLVHDGVGIWLAARRLHQGRFACAR